MPKEVLINAGAGEIRVALVEDGTLQELMLERTLGLEDGPSRGRGGHSLVGNIILGRVQRVLPGMQAAFVDVGLDRAGFLGAREARCLADLPGFEEERAPKIGECVREGEEILVQVVKDPIGDKGARLSANVTIPGRLAVLVPNQPGIALSRRIEGAEERARLLALGEAMIAHGGARLVTGAGYILRTAATTATVNDLLEDAERLAEMWRPVMAKRKTASVPSTLYHDLDPVERTLRDLVRDDTVRILIDDAGAAEAARAYCRRAMPQAESRIEHFNGPGQLFDLYDLEDEIARLTEPRVPLPSGGWITIEATEALTAIDVNSGSYTAATGLEETSVRVNLEAADEIGRQIRLRGIGGLIVVDFIHLAEPAHIEQVLGVLSASISRDHTPTQILPMSEFGLVEITRKRVREPLFKLVSECCRSCTGRGRKRKAESVALDVVRQAERAAASAPGRTITVRAAPEVAAWLEDHGEEVRRALARRGATRLRFEPSASYAREGFDVSTS
ncbi:MAG: Rne/Rng family ribonuclease [Alphaproteobacteria bacterium]|nr:Rne/Rng family ribonuclease [Alphaproteobacteria bacterium]MBV9695191.1 Rne/Rng family ribonuclease [Alphaproteobacteria bacterium]